MANRGGTWPKAKKEGWETRYFYVEKDLSGMNADTAALLHAFISYTYAPRHRRVQSEVGQTFASTLEHPVVRINVLEECRDWSRTP